MLHKFKIRTPFRRKPTNAEIATGLLLLVVAMIGVSFAAVPLYNLFCQITGFGGTTMRATSYPEQVYEREFKVSFNADTEQNLPWTFEVKTAPEVVKLGAPAKAMFRVKNNSDRAITGIATYNVTPEKMGVYFQKVECFCFETHVLQPHEEREFPIMFFIDPSALDDKNVADVHDVTLSYTYFEAKD